MKLKQALLIVAFFITSIANAQNRDVAFSIMKVNPHKVSDRLLTSNTMEMQEMTVLLSDRVDMEVMRKRFDAENTPLAERTEIVIRTLKQKANATQPLLLEVFRNNPKIDANSIEAYWIVNMIKITARLDVIETLSNMPEIAFIDLNTPLALDEFTTESYEDGVDGLNVVNGIEPGLAAINAPAMWALGYTGFGTKALSIDTGVEPNHPAFNYKYQGLFSSNSEAWFDYNGQTDTPNDCDGHGTHTVGTMLGLDRENNDTIGVAFDATWMGAQAICGGGSADNMASFQWAIDPDGDSTTIDDMPTVICNSWYDPASNNSQCGGAYQNLFDAVEAVGIAVIFSAGNDGPSVSTITAPKNVNNDLVSVFCVGALSVSSSFTQSIASFSSRGPSTCGDTGSYLIKPEVSAPGVNVRSADLNGTYSFKSGTSMAAPHVSGAVLLLKQAFPTLSGRQIKLALYYSAIDLGIPGEDNDYGMGAIDVFAAYQYLINQGHVPANPYSNRDLAAQNLALPDILCDINLTVSPSVEFVNMGTDTIYNAIIRYTFSSGLTDTIQWSGVAAHGDTLLILINPITLNGGFYDFEIESELINGLADERVLNNKLSKSFLLTASEEVTTQNTTTCLGSDALLFANHSSTTGEIRWYGQAEGGAIAANGNSFVIPNLQNNETYFADIIETKNIGAIDKNIGSGINSNSLNPYLEFDCFTPFVLKSVKVYASTTGGRKIVLRDANGNILAQKLFSIPQIGENIITINWKVSRGENLQLGVDLVSNYYINTNGSAYPYEIQDVLTIKGSNLSQNQYPFFYDWQIEYGSPCGRVPATALVGNGTTETNFSTSADSLDLSLTNGEVSFVDSTQNAVLWFWDFGDGNTSTQQNPTHIYTQPGVYQVHLQTENNTGCSDAMTQEITVLNFPVSTIGVDILNQNIKIYPNPTNDILNIELNLDKKSTVQFQLFDAVGQLILNQKTTDYNNQKTTLNLTDLPSGIYFLQIRIDEKVMTKKVIRY
jgi:subtilisin family serine protease/PKD repeat protein